MHTDLQHEGMCFWTLLRLLLVTAELTRALDLHNQYRSKHQVGPLSWDDNLQRSAQNWADRCVWEHSNGDYGENLAKGQQSFEEAVQDWYNEVSLACTCRAQKLQQKDVSCHDFL